MVWQAAAAGLGQGASQAGVTNFLNPVSRNLEYLANHVQPNKVPEADALMRLLAQGRISDFNARRLLRFNGIVGPQSIDPGDVPGVPNVYRDIWEQVYQSTLAVPAPGEMLELLNRRWIDDEVANRWLRQGGMAGADERGSLLQLRHAQPGPSDLISFALKEGWDPAVVERFQYDAEFPDEFRHWMQFQGFNQADPRPGWLRDQSPWVPWPQMYWRVHWANIAPGQAYEMYQRLRAGRLAQFQVGGLNPREFTLDDLRQILKINDYPPPFRDQLAALAYRVPRLVDLDHFYHLRLIGEGELYELHLDLGYNPTDADRRKRYIVNADAVARRKMLVGNLTPQIKELYRLGIIDRDTAKVRLYEEAWQGSTNVEWPQGADFAHKLNVANQDANVNAALDQVDLLDRVETVKLAVADIRRRYQHGILNDQAAEDSLTNEGIAAARAHDLVERWNLAFRGVRVASSARTLMRWLKRGIIDVNTFNYGLRQLGYEAARIDYMRTEVQQDVNLQIARAQEKAAQTAKQQQAAQLAQLRALKQQQQQALAQLTRNASAADLTRWFINGVITQQQLAAALAARQYDAASVAARVADAVVQRNDKLAAKAAKQAQLQKQLQKGGGGGGSTSGGSPGNSGQAGGKGSSSGT